MGSRKFLRRGSIFFIAVKHTFYGQDGLNIVTDAKDNVKFIVDHKYHKVFSMLVKFNLEKGVPLDIISDSEPLLCSRGLVKTVQTFV